MATSSFISSVVVNEETASSIKKAMNSTTSKLKTQKAKKVVRLEREEIRKFKFK